MLLWNCFNRLCQTRVRLVHLRGFIVRWSDYYVVEKHDMELKARQLLDVFPLRLWHHVSKALLSDINTCFPRIPEEHDFTVKKKPDLIRSWFFLITFTFQYYLICQCLFYFSEVWWSRWLKHHNLSMLIATRYWYIVTYIRYFFN